MVQNNERDEAAEMRAQVAAEREHIQEWVDALRSGDYEQCRGALHWPRTGAFCALGVACEIYPGGEWTPQGEFKVGLHIAEATLPRAVAEWLGLYSGRSLSQSDIVILNDVDMLTFEEIADEIEAVYLR